MRTEKKKEKEEVGARKRDISLTERGDHPTGLNTLKGGTISALIDSREGRGRGERGNVQDFFTSSISYSYLLYILSH